MVYIYIIPENLFMGNIAERFSEPGNKTPVKKFIIILNNTNEVNVVTVIASLKGTAILSFLGLLRRFPPRMTEIYREMSFRAKRSNLVLIILQEAQGKKAKGISFFVCQQSSLRDQRTLHRRRASGVR